MTQSFNRFASWFTFIFVLAMFLPRVVGQGMFADGFCYSSMARNMAEGRGWLWAPFFSSSFWLSYNSGAVYYENMPLMFWMQSWFFKLFGDFWWVEKLYCGILLLACYWVITLIFKKFTAQKSFAWLPILIWYTMPIILWASPNNQMDYTMALFSMIAVYILPFGKESRQPSVVFYALAGFFTFVAFLAKGPVGVFPLAVPFLHWFVFRDYSFSKMLMNSFWVLATFALSFVLLFQYPPAKHYVLQFLDQQLFSAISGRREQAADSFARLYILKQLLIQTAPMFGLGLIFLFFAKKIKLVFQPSENRKTAFFMLLIALSASLPIMISPKQHEIYLIPAMPFYALAGAFFLLPAVQTSIESRTWNLAPYLKYLGVLLILVLVYTSTLVGKPSREKDVLADMEILSQHIPEGAKVGVCETMMGDFVIHCYLQRYHKWELTRDFSKTNYIITQSSCGNPIVENGFHAVELPEKQVFSLFERD